MKKIVVIDGQGGRIGGMLVQQVKKLCPDAEVVAIGTNGIATAAMLKAGADVGATGENPVVVNCRDANAVLGPIGILAADSLAGEVTPAMAVAVGQSPAQKILLPVNRCNHTIVGVKDMPLAEMAIRAAEQMKALLG